MKRWIFFIFLFNLNQVVHAQIPWSEPITVSGGINPYFAINRETGNLHVVAILDSVIYTLMDSLGNIVDQDSLLGTACESGHYRFGPSIDVDHYGYPHICYRRPYQYDNDEYCDVFYTQKSEIGWTFQSIAYHVKRGHVIRLAIDQTNIVHMARGYATATPRGKVIYAQISHGDYQEIQTDLGPYRVDNRFEIDVDQDDRVHLLIGNPDPQNNGIYYYRTDVGGRELEEVDAGSGGIQSSSCVGRNGSPDVFTDTSGNIHMCYGTSADNSRDGQPSIHYIRYTHTTKVRDIMIDEITNLLPWHSGFGIGSIAASDDGKYVVIAYLTRGGGDQPLQDLGDLYLTVSSDYGVNWETPILMANSVGGSLGRNLPLIRAYRNHFYLIYPNNYPTEIRLRLLRHMGDPLPAAHAGGPYTGFEGDSVLFDASGSSDEGQNAGIVKYIWDWENDAVFDFSTPDSITYHVYPDDFIGEVKLRVEDRAQRNDDYITNVHILNVPPTIDAGEDRMGNEGDTLTFYVDINDPGLDEHDIEWKFGTDSSPDKQEVTVYYDDEINYQVFVTVTDGDGGLDRDTVNVNILNVSPTAEAGGPYYAIINKPITFYGEGYDPGVYDVLQYYWDLDGDQNYEEIGESVTTSYSDVGNYMIYLLIDDKDGGVGVDSAMVYITNLNPVISTIPDQIIDEGDIFSPLLLDNYVSDPDQEDHEMTWSCHGNSVLDVILENRILQVSLPDSEWFGQEMLTLVVTDPGGLQDSVHIEFIVNPVNDPPRWVETLNYSFNEDDSLIIHFSDLQSQVVDIDDSLEDLDFSIDGNHYTKWRLDTASENLVLCSIKDWYGTETVSFTVSDTTGSNDSYNCEIRVVSIGDSPKPFYLIEPMFVSYSEWPDTVTFRWHQSEDPDSGSILFYIWTLKKQVSGSESGLYNQSTLDTVYHLVSGHQIGDGTYFWWVEVFDQTDSSAKSLNEGIVKVGQSTNVDGNQNLPEKYQLLQNYPNPFNARTVITFHLPEKSKVELVIFNQLGQVLRILDDGWKQGGIYSVIWDGCDQRRQRVPTGIYFCRFRANDFISYQKMVLIQ